MHHREFPAVQRKDFAPKISKQIVAFNKNDRTKNEKGHITVGARTSHIHPFVLMSLKSVRPLPAKIIAKNAKKKRKAKIDKKKSGRGKGRGRGWGRGRGRGLVYTVFLGKKAFTTPLSKPVNLKKLIIFTA